MYEQPSPLASMVRSQVAGQNYPGSAPLFDKIQAQTRDMRATTDLTQKLQRDQLEAYVAGTPESFDLATAAKNNAAGLPAEMQAMQEGFYTASTDPTVANNVSNNLIKSLNVGSSAANKITEADRKADMTTTLMGGDMQAFMQNLLAKQNTAPPTQQNTAPPEDNFMGNLFRMFAQPEFQQAGFEGQGFGPTVLGATNALRAMDTQDAETAKLEAAANAEMLKAQAEAAGPWDAKSFQIEQFKNLTRSMGAVGTINKMKELLSAGSITGGPASALGALKGLGDIVGISLDPSKREKYQDQVDQLATALVSSGVFGREVNKSEWDTIFRLIARPDIAKGPGELLNRLNSLMSKINRSIESDSRSLRLQGVPLDQLIAPSEPLFSRGN